ncbi:MAG: hypothetical protein A2487_14810 [Candidatus Raymondbacteria bacterium RifOxyC12_full_50_8]|uniref:Secretion system C-terminal sorting domain-containing protein n=1 Tax=Candidatus Raymondbacteria bacterium RIFOXYD12_FULL_49_13 TaxID=1817890 RepID=A0A1F7FIP2_UNCRA|nr:MAG: hypothetical protein A2248_21340 [Candidatus Raymondbacteria bacterium RIFOXYA2_FULL_49_16]OGJ97429.1 MAG: hypothetical protein A2487_14810 [Candidatus Raymondbacteria bacterium RifOxyC12_full_50_8]OGJ98652.1 MAG: hypothetical protein A2350_13990 [Candidatus Raymondbacteria bacterium RifOxyB12_full_50_8]OGK06332.1 MAG: hypothetical protein A2519_08660 [Candidatus Raymondbacteria bacterium RIFOXYD12_FULL_49_13]OGP40666.1 MAG: hypothetical protein A2324_03410 [Candidatus Raymondbacteria b
MKKQALLFIACAALSIHGLDFSVYTTIDQETKDSLRANWLAKFPASGYVHGNVATFGASVTNSRAFWCPFPGSATGVVPNTNAESYLIDKDDDANCAVNGYTVDDGILCLSGAMNTLKPEVIICKYGGNDIFKNKLSTFPRRFRQYITIILLKGIIPIMSTINPVMDNGIDLTPEVLAANDSVRAIAREKHVVLVDYWQAFMDYTNNNPFTATWFGDQYVHPSGGCNLTDTATPACGYGIRNAVSWHAVNKVYRIIVENGTPDHVGLEQQAARSGGFIHALEAYPNPFNANTVITMTNDELSDIAGMNPELKIYNIRGKMVADLSSNTRNPKFIIHNSFKWNASNFPSGVYTIRAKKGNTIASKNIFLIK